MVDSKLEQFVKDLGIGSDVFVNACELASDKVHKSIVKQLLAVENFLLFKKMMITRNKQLNEEAIKNMKSEIQTEGNTNAANQYDEELEERLAREREEAELAQAIAESEALEQARLQKLQAEEPKPKPQQQ